MNADLISFHACLIDCMSLQNSTHRAETIKVQGERSKRIEIRILYLVTITIIVTAMRSLRIAPFLVVIISLLSCSKEDAGPSNTNPGSLTPKDSVYVTGVWDTGAAYWHNGNTTNLDPGVNFYPTSICVSNTDIFVAGSTRDAAGKVQAVLLKNGVSTELHDGTNVTNAFAVAVSGSGVFVAGTADSSGVQIAIVWKNGVASHLPNGERAKSIFISGSDVYVAGPTQFKANYTPAYWKNGDYIKLSNENSFTEGIAVAGTDVYVSGTRGDGSALYWKNGVVNNLTSSGIYAVTSISVSGTDVYVGGFRVTGKIRNVMYWKNGIAAILTNDGITGQIQVSGSDVYLAGGVNKVGSGLRATFWKNGRPTDLGSGTATGVFVK